jgi:hypothetical protein
MGVVEGCDPTAAGPSGRARWRKDLFSPMLGRSQKIKGPEDFQREAVNAVNEPEEALVLDALGGR